MTVDKFGRHINKHVHNHIYKKLLTNLHYKTLVLKNKEFNIKGQRLTGISDSPKHESDAINLKYVQKNSATLANNLTEKYTNYVNEQIFVFRNKMEDLIKENKYMIIVNLLLDLHGNIYKIQNGNSEEFYKFPFDTRIKKVQYNTKNVLIETTINDKPIKLDGLSVKENDILKFLVIKGRVNPPKVSVELILETKVL